MNSEITDFQSDVLDRSHRVPVLVDFWAPWCGPCRTLGPVLEGMATEAGGRWELAKVNVDEHREPATRYAVGSIPAVKLFSAGKVVAEFVGALPQPEIEHWLEEHLPNPATGQLAEAEARLQALDFGGAAELAHGVPGDGLGRGQAERRAWILARALVYVDPVEARTWLDAVTFEVATDPELESVRFLANWLGVEAPVVADIPEEASDAFRRGDRALRQGDLESALEAFIAVLWEKPDFAEGVAKRLTLSIFHLIGMRHPLTEEYVRSYSSATNV